MPRMKSEEARTKMIQAAGQIILQKGVEGVTLAEVVKSSGVAKTTFYRHFDSIAELVISACHHAEEEIEIPDTGSLYNDLHLLANLYLPLYEEVEQRRMAISIIHASTTSEELFKLHCAFDAKRVRPIQAITKAAIEREELSDDLDIELACLFIEGPFVKQVLIMQETFTESQLDTVIGMICRALGAMGNDGKFKRASK